MALLTSTMLYQAASHHNLVYFHTRHMTCILLTHRVTCHTPWNTFTYHLLAGPAQPLGITPGPLDGGPRGAPEVQGRRLLHLRERRAKTDFLEQRLDDWMGNRTELRIDLDRRLSPPLGTSASLEMTACGAGVRAVFPTSGKRRARLLFSNYGTVKLPNPEWSRSVIKIANTVAQRGGLY